MRERCFLCGGPLAGGRCMECGLDNTKNDKKYQLNTHNASGAHFHEGECADNLNQPKKLHRKKKKTEQREETFDYRKLLEQERRKVHAGSSYREKKSVKETVSGKESSADRLADKTKRDVTRSGSSAADSGRKNGSTRAGKKKNRLGTILVILFLVFSFAGPFLEHMADWLDEMLEEFGGYGFAEDDLFHWEDAEWVTEAESPALSVSPGESLGEPNEEWENSADSGDEDEIYGYIGPGENGEKPEVGMTVDNEQQAYRRIPLTEGTELVLEYGEAGDAALIPSY